MRLMGIIGNTVYFWIDGARLEIKGQFSDGDIEDLIEHQDAKRFDAYKEMESDFFQKF